MGMAKHDLITKDFALYVVHYFNSMLTWSKEEILGEIDRVIKEAKPEDAVRVVRCEKCRYYEKAEYDEGYKMVCRLLKRQTASNGYCYCGERKDNDRMLQDL